MEQKKIKLSDETQRRLVLALAIIGKLIGVGKTAIIPVGELEALIQSQIGVEMIGDGEDVIIRVLKQDEYQKPEVLAS